MAVPAMPERQAVETDKPLEEREAGKQENLDQRQVARKQRRDPPEAEQDIVEVVPVIADAVRPTPAPDPEDSGAVPEHENPEGDRERGARTVAAAAPSGRLACHTRPKRRGV